MSAHEISVNADSPDYGKRWGVISEDSVGCWCYTHTMQFLDKYNWRESGFPAHPAAAPASPAQGREGEGK